MGLFDFITNEDFRSSLESDFREMSICADAEAWKAVHVLSGSIIEAILIDYLVSANLVSLDDALKMDLGRALTISKDKQVLSAKTVDLSSVIKEYRNLIHPGRFIRLSENVDKSTAEVAKALVHIVFKEVEKRKRENYGYTAEQIVSKLKCDSSADAILNHLLKKTNPIEIERLIFKVIPENYALALEDDSPFYAQAALVSCFRTAFTQFSEELKKKSVEKFVRAFREESDDMLSKYVIPFLRCNDLQYVSAEDADLIKQHLLSKLQNKVNIDLLKALEGIEGYISSEDIVKFVDPLIRTICDTNREWSIKEIAQERITQAWFYLKDDLDKSLMNRIDVWINFSQDKGNFPQKVKIEQIKEAIYDNVPF